MATVRLNGSFLSASNLTLVCYTGATPPVPRVRADGQGWAGITVVANPVPGMPPHVRSPRGNRIARARRRRCSRTGKRRPGGALRHASFHRHGRHSRGRTRRRVGAARQRAGGGSVAHGAGPPAEVFAVAMPAAAWLPVQGLMLDGGGSSVPCSFTMLEALRWRRCAMAVAAPPAGAASRCTAFCHACRAARSGEVARRAGGLAGVGAVPVGAARLQGVCGLALSSPPST